MVAILQRICVLQSFNNISKINHSENTMYVCQKKSIDGGKTWGNLTYPFGREIATREASPVFDFINNKLVVVANLMDSQLIMVSFCFCF